MSKSQKIHAAALAHGQSPLPPITSSISKGKNIPPVIVPEKYTPSSGGPKTPKTPQDEGIDFFESSLVVSGDIPIQVYELRLDPDGGPNKERTYTRLPSPFRPYILRVSLAAGTPASKNGVLKTNFPLEGGQFGRFNFTEKKLPTDFSKPIQIDLPISHAGAFLFWIEYDGPTGRVKGREGYFNIDPVLRIKKRPPILSASLQPIYAPISIPQIPGSPVRAETVMLPLDGLSILTVVSKWMGNITEWAPHFSEARERGYNMLHFPPLQQRGESDSPYSIADQLQFDEALFESTWSGSVTEGTERMRELLEVAKDEYGLLSLTDVVLNHTANNSTWLLDHPEAGFSPLNTPHLTPAAELDTAMIDFSVSLASLGLPPTVSSSADVEVLMNAFAEYLKPLKFWQYYVIDVTSEKATLETFLNSGNPIPPWEGPKVSGKTFEEIAELLKSIGKVKKIGTLEKRFGVHVDAIVAASVVTAAFCEIKGPADLVEAWAKVLDIINVPLYREWEEDTRIALEHMKNRVKYTRLDDHGPKLGPITAQLPLVETYFTRLPVNERTSKHDPSALFLANNGWIWAADPLVNFALPPSKAYLRREVIVWGDCVKLNYGSGPEDNPWLWEHMTKYVCSLAEIFDGFRLDNCHSTPLHVGVAFLDAARVVKPNLYVCAELFTGNEEMDITFVSRLGINSLIREAMSGSDPKEFSRTLYRFGLGKPIGSMDAACLTIAEELPPPTGKGPTRPCLVTPMQGSVPHALLFDLTHDNESPLHKRSAEDALSTGALVAFSQCAIGSVKGFDDLHPKLLNLVAEKRKYEIRPDGGIGKVKRVLNHLHAEMMLEGYSEGHVHEENGYISIHRVHPGTQKGYIVVAHTAFSQGNKDRGWINPIRLRRTKAQFILGAIVDIPSYSIPSDPDVIRGLASNLVEIGPVNAIESSDDEGPFSEIVVPDRFPPGSILLFATQLEGLDATLDNLCKTGSDEAFKDLDFVDLNVILYRSDVEERDATSGRIGAYEVPGMGKLVYCGLQGWMAALKHIVTYNDLGHSLCGHLRSGTWALDYVHSRLFEQVDILPRLSKPAVWLKERFEKIKTTVPPFLRPKYFAIVILEAYRAGRRAAVEQCSDFVSGGHDFTQDLAMCSIQMYGLVNSASLDPGKVVPSLAAGLPHFTTGWARCWGRDVFISLRGLFLTTGNFLAAKHHILAFCSTLKHGLIPNLLDSVRSPRYNSRDSPWWMLQNIQDYATLAPGGLSILSEQVKRRFPQDDSYVPWDDPKAYSYSSTVAEIIQEILQRHATGIKFKEYNAGPNLDMQMDDAGFNIDIHVDWKTGFIFGGNDRNCGTWMDKMGESQKAGTKGKPGTPRDGAPIEIIGLLKSTLRWLDSLARSGEFPFQGVQAEISGKLEFVTYKQWNDLLQTSFEEHFYVPLSMFTPLASLVNANVHAFADPEEDALYNVNPSIINRRGIYKDVLGSGAGREWSDYQLRCNFPIAMTVAPELFDLEHAIGALRTADKVLRSPLGMKTLDPADSQYRGYYDNANDSTDGSIAKGLNYHNGPEWGWPLGYFLRAYLHFDTRAGISKTDINETLHYLYTMLLGPRRHIQTDQWAGLPELTNRDGEFCHDSCPTQAWSASTLLDFLETVHRYNLQ